MRYGPSEKFKRTGKMDLAAVEVVLVVWEKNTVINKLDLS